MGKDGVQSNIMRAVALAGGQSALARELGVTRQTVRVWLINGFVPAKWVDAVERVTAGKVKSQSMIRDIVKRHRWKAGGDER